MRLTIKPKLWLLDRDGVINADVGAPGVIRRDDLSLIPGSAGAIRRLRLAAPVAIVTNQSCRGLGLLSKADLDGIHEALRHLIAKTARGGLASQDGRQWDAMYICEDAQLSERKKPEPGMVLEALADFGCTPNAAVMIGDSWSDVVAAQRAGCCGVLVATGHGASLGAILSQRGVRLPTTLTAELIAADAAFGGWVAERSANEAALIREALRTEVRVYANLLQATDELLAQAEAAGASNS